LIWIKCSRPAVINLNAMTSTQHPPIRHCPLCGIAMQASKSRDDLTHFDTFKCLSCDTAIVETQARRPPRPRSR
jgi:hypothetical protein